MIDLHGLHVAEAVRVAKDQVQTARSSGNKVVRFIVGKSFDKPCRMCDTQTSDLGKGLHADDGEAKVRPALQGHFTKYVRRIVPVSMERPESTQ